MLFSEVSAFSTYSSCSASAGYRESSSSRLSSVATLSGLYSVYTPLTFLASFLLMASVKAVNRSTVVATGSRYTFSILPTE